MPILIILRHGKAEADASSGRDADRALRERGRAQATYIAERLKGSAWKPALILHSGLTRADQTAGIVAEGIGAPRRRLGALEFGDERSGIASLTELLGPHLAESSPLMIVGHNTQLEDLAGILANGPAGAGSLRLRTGEACVFDIPDPHEPLAGATLLEVMRLDGEL